MVSPYPKFFTVLVTENRFDPPPVDAEKEEMLAPSADMICGRPSN